MGADPLSPMQMAAICGWMGAGRYNVPVVPTARADFLRDLAGSEGIAQFRNKCRTKLGYTNNQAKAIQRRTDAVNLLMNACPFR